VDEVSFKRHLAASRAALARTGHAPRPRSRPVDAPVAPVDPPELEAVDESARIAELEAEVARLRAALARIGDASHRALAE